MGRLRGFAVDIVIALVRATFYAAVVGWGLLLAMPVFALLLWQDPRSESVGTLAVWASGIAAPITFVLMLVQTVRERRLNRRGIKTREQLDRERERRWRGEPAQRWWDWLI